MNLMDSIIMAMPILPGKIQEAKKYFENLKAEKWQEFCRSEERAGILKERDFLQVTPNGDLILMYLEAKNISNAFETFAASQDPFDVYVKGEVKKLTGVDLNKPSTEPTPKLLLAYDK